MGQQQQQQRSGRRREGAAAALARGGQPLVAAAPARGAGRPRRRMNVAWSGAAGGAGPADYSAAGAARDEE
ncbi:hypothetical protein AB0J55_37495 [Amycolatopsis sp. NPDC049688]|uniref:hypothetical protein n=1 Tax=Amycolatopsis sp. NPDC049688 TaxID=3154733 RepID=UPI00342CACB3